MKIRKRIDFDFLGEEYEGAYGVFASIPISEYPSIRDTVDKENDSIKKSMLMLAKIKEKFISGKWPGDDGKLEDIQADDLDGADGELLLTVYNRLMGVEGDPKVSSPSETTSTPAETPLSNT